MTSEALPDFTRIYVAYHKKVRAYAAKLIGPEEAEDVAQEVFVRVRRSLATLADPSKLSSWIRAITLNAVRDAARKRSARGDREVAGPAGPRGDEETSDPLARVADVTARTPEELAIRSEMVACYLDYVNELPPSYGEIYFLSEFDDLSNEEIARRLSLSLATVKIRLHRARARLFGKLRRNCHCYVNDRGELMGAPKGRQG
ncbi:MAG: RNA polymerase sigma factor [Thermoanaerobaculia bacterium]